MHKGAQEFPATWIGDQVYARSLNSCLTQNMKWRDSLGEACLHRSGMPVHLTARAKQGARMWLGALLRAFFVNIWLPIRWQQTQMAGDGKGKLLERLLGITVQVGVVAAAGASRQVAPSQLVCLETGMQWMHFVTPL